ncbi:hypothetical protein [Klebsiella phage vB_KpnS-VAC7]|uniref:Uncharacterized protein n=2 Tax=Webervirus TaxID=1920860 RepID=A0AAE8BY58_9CAUD|nr:hypothetical protein [Klebsiella phage vB_KpnS-VAC4]QZE50807.1 hypothetical protein [Klebsiella phage vB_KpnS-VAC7]
MINNNIIIITLSLYTYLGKISPGYVSFFAGFRARFFMDIYL